MFCYGFCFQSRSYGYYAWCLSCDYIAESGVSKTYAQIGGTASWVVGGRAVGALVLSVYSGGNAATWGIGACCDALMNYNSGNGYTLSGAYCVDGLYCGGFAFEIRLGSTVLFRFGA